MLVDPYKEKKLIGHLMDIQAETGDRVYENRKPKLMAAWKISADGNITRLDNAFEKMPEKLKILSEKL